MERKGDPDAFVTGREMQPHFHQYAHQMQVNPTAATLPASGINAGQFNIPTAASSSIPPSPFSLESGRDDDAALFQDARTGFSHLVPGRPIQGNIVGGNPKDPPCDAILHVQDAPITIRYRLEPPSRQAPSANELARLTAEGFASWRAQTNIQAALTNPTWLLSWGAEAAAVATYELIPEPSSRTVRPREDLFVLVRQGMLYLVTWTYPTQFVEEPAYASFASVAEATMIWDPLRWEQRGRVWPESSFIGAGINGAIKPRHNETARIFARASLDDTARAHLLIVLSGIVSNVGAPWVQLRPNVLEANRRAIVSAFREPDLRSFADAAFAEVQTAHDLRGLAILLGHAIGRAPSQPPIRTASRPSRA